METRRAALKRLVSVAGAVAVGAAVIDEFGKYDARLPSMSPAVHRWLIDHGVDFKNVYHVDISIPVNGLGEITVHRFKLDENGRRYFDRAANEVAREEPQTILLAALPDHLIAMHPWAVYNA